VWAPCDGCSWVLAGPRQDLPAAGPAAAAGRLPPAASPLPPTGCVGQLLEPLAQRFRVRVVAEVGHAQQHHLIQQPGAEDLLQRRQQAPVRCHGLAVLNIAGHGRPREEPWPHLLLEGGHAAVVVIANGVSKNCTSAAVATAQGCARRLTAACRRCRTAAAGGGGASGSAAGAHIHQTQGECGGAATGQTRGRPGMTEHSQQPAPALLPLRRTWITSSSSSTAQCMGAETQQLCCSTPPLPMTACSTSW
jgi:hypothetical protein